MQNDSPSQARAMRIWRTIEATEGVSFGWQVAAFLAALLAVFSRLPGAFLHPQFFAEDGWVWYQQAYNLHWLRSLSIPQAGYIQMLPRLVAGVTLLFPMQWAPMLMNWCGAVVQVLPVTALLSRRCATWGPLPLRILMAVIYIAIPDAPEVHIVVTNAMWHLALLQALLAFSAPPLGWRGRVSDLIVFGIGAITGPFCILLLPLVAAYWWIRRQRWTLTVLGVLFLGFIVQGFTLLHSVRSAGAPLGVNAVRLLRIIAGNIFFNSMVGSGGAYLRVGFLVVCCHRRAGNPGLGLAQRAPCGAPVHRLCGFGSDGIPERSSAPGEPYAALGDAREERWNPLLVFAFADVSLVRGMVRLEGKTESGAVCGRRRFAADDDWRHPKMDLPAVAGK